MSNIAEQEELVETLKFIPMDVEISLLGYGGEIVLGNVSKKSVDYFESNEIDLEEYCHDWDNESEVPEDMQPFEPGEWHDCDNITHEYGVELSSSCRITVEDTKGNTLWEQHLDYNELSELGVIISESDEVCAEDHTGPVFMGQSLEKGCFYTATLRLTAPFDPSKLTLYTTEVEGWLLCTGVEYDNEEVENTGDGSTSGKGFYGKFLNTDGE